MMNKDRLAIYGDKEKYASHLKAIDDDEFKNG